MITGRLFSTTVARLKPLGARHAPTDHLTPLSLACALLLCAFTLVADTAVEVPVPVASPQAWLQSDLQRALADVHASMVELPPKAEAAAVAQLASKAQMILLENRKLAAEVRVLQAEYAELRGEQQTELAELQRSIDQMLDELSWLRGQHEKLQDDVKAALTHPVDTLSSPNLVAGRDLDVKNLNAGDLRRGSLVAGIPADATGTATSDAPVHHEAAPSLFAGTDQSPMPDVSTIALNIAYALKETRKDAMLTRQERAFTLDVDKRVFVSDPIGGPISLDRNLNLSLYTARSELLAPRIGRIVFFPDGTSTGGRVGLDLYGSRAAIKVDWSTGIVSVEG